MFDIVILCVCMFIIVLCFIRKFKLRILFIDILVIIIFCSIDVLFSVRLIDVLLYIFIDDLLVDSIFLLIFFKC